jgi:hypothetical protein
MRGDAHGPSEDTTPAMNTSGHAHEEPCATNPIAVELTSGTS